MSLSDKAAALIDQIAQERQRDPGSRESGASDDQLENAAVRVGELAGYLENEAAPPRAALHGTLAHSIVDSWTLSSQLGGDLAEFEGASVTTLRKRHYVE